MYEIFEKDRQGTVLRIERSSIHDGDGFRTVVFLKGCPLRCQWCSTPESQLFGIQQTAENVYGKLMTVGEVVHELRKDSLFYFLSTGGVTLSGGEVLAQPDFAGAILRNCKQECFNTAIETCLSVPWENVEPLLPYINTIYADLKLVDSELHKKYCGVDNGLILDNLHKADEAADGHFRLIIRTPIIPGVNDSDEELNRIGEFGKSLQHLDHIQLLPYHRLGTATYQKLGRPYLLEDVVPPTPEHMEHCRSVVRRYVRRVV